MAKARFTIKRKARGQNVEPAPPAPQFLTLPSHGVLENQALDIELSANQPNCIFSIIGGADASEYSLAGSTLTLPAQNFEDPGHDNTYTVDVRATNANGSDDLTITVTVADASEGAGIEPGSTAFGSWAATVYTTPEGDPLDWGYNQRAIGGWTVPMHEKVTGVYYLGVTAWKAPTEANFALGKLRGIKEVRFSVNNGPWLVVTTPSAHPVYDNDCYVAELDSASFSASGRAEARAIVIPDSGQPFILQGIIDPRDGWTIVQQGSTFRHNAYRPDMWSLLLNIDKTGSDLPKLVVYKAPPGSGSDSNTGLSAAQAFATWDKVFDYAEAQLGSNIGGLEVRLTAGLNHVMPGTEDIARTTLVNSVRYTKIYGATSQYVRITRDPAVAKSAVKATTRSTYSWRCEKAQIDGFEKSVSFVNQTSGNNFNLNYFDVLIRDITHDGGPGVDANGQPSGEGLCSINGSSSQGHFAVLNTDIAKVNFAGMHTGTLMGNITVDDHSENGDIWNDIKVLFNCEVFNTIDLAGGNHLDVLQFKFGRTMHIVEDLKMPQANGCVCQFLLSDGNCVMTDTAYIRCVGHNNGYTAPVFSLNAAPKNLYLLHPKMTPTGATNQQWTDAHWSAPAIDSRMVMAADSDCGTFETNVRAGWSVIGP